MIKMTVLMMLAFYQYIAQDPIGLQCCSHKPYMSNDNRLLMVIIALFQHKRGVKNILLQPTEMIVGRHNGRSLTEQNDFIDLLLDNVFCCPVC